MTALTVLIHGLGIGDSPHWHAGRLWLSNWGTQEIIAVDLTGTLEMAVRVPTSIPFCFDWLPDGRLLIVSGPEARLLTQEADGALATYADLATTTTTRLWLTERGPGRLFKRYLKPWQLAVSLYESALQANHERWRKASIRPCSTRMITTASSRSM
jgi:hypothetical protein